MQSTQNELLTSLKVTYVCYHIYLLSTRVVVVVVGGSGGGGGGTYTHTHTHTHTHILNIIVFIK